MVTGILISLELHVEQFLGHIIVSVVMSYWGHNVFTALLSLLH